LASVNPKTAWYSSSPPISNSILVARGCKTNFASLSLHNFRLIFKSKLDLTPKSLAFSSANLTVSVPVFEIAHVIPVV
jgi:hypothetical protein